MFENRLTIKIKDAVLFNDLITDDEIELFNKQEEEFGLEVAKTNLLINLTQRLIKAKRIRITYFKKEQEQ